MARNGGREGELPAPTLEGLWWRWRIVEVVRRVKQMGGCLMVMRDDLGKGRPWSACRDEGVMRMGMDAYQLRGANGGSEQTTWWWWWLCLRMKKEVVGGRGREGEASP